MQHKNLILGFLAVVIVGLVGFIVWGNAHKMKVEQQASVQSVSTQQNTEPVVSKQVKASTDIVDPKDSTVHTYTSYKLGVSFQYVDDHVFDPVVVENGNTISVGEGQSTITMFEKDPTLTLGQAVTKTLLSTYDPKKCWFEQDSKLSNGLYHYEGGDVSFIPYGDGIPHPEPGTCANQYAKTNAVRGFVYDPLHPDRFYFINDGQAVAEEAPKNADGQIYNYDYTLQIIDR